MAYNWQFFRAGGTDQVVIRSGADLAHLGELDQKLWVALACPTRGIEIDPATLDLIDTDKDGRIRPPELIEACRWACAQLRNADELIEPSELLEVASIDDSSESGAALAVEAKRVLGLVGKSETDALTLADVTDRKKLIAAMRLNGDGIITTQTPEDEALRPIIQSIIDTQGGVVDLNGEAGIDQAKADKFFADAAALRDWRAKVAGDKGIQAYGDATGAAAEALEAVRIKIDDFFARCRLSSFDETAVAEMNPSQDRYKELATQALSLKSAAIADLPLAAIAAGRTLPLLDATVNPAWAAALKTFQKDTVAPQFDATRAELNEADWVALQAELEPYRQWLITRPPTSLDALSVDAVDAIANGDAQSKINALIADDKAVEPRNARIVDLERLLRYKRDLLRLVHNFVSFKDFYRREGAIFEAGTLYLDARSCDLSVPVSDIGKHSVLAVMAKACLAYCECHRNGQKMNIVSAFTAGDTDFLWVGRNGIFYDRHGDDWDATIVKLIDNPTNVRQAFLSPYKKFIRAIEEQVAKRAAASDAAAQSNMTTLATGVASTGTAPASAATTAAGSKVASKMDVGTVAALGVALGSISAVVVGIFGKFIEMGWWIPVGILGIMLAISGPSMAVAWLKLRQRSLGPILDATGWAINGRMKVNVRLGGMLSKLPHIPLGARPMKDPYADSHKGLDTIFTVIIILLIVFGIWRFGLANRWLPANVQYPAVAAQVATALRGGAPAPAPVPAPGAPAAR